MSTSNISTGDRKAFYEQLTLDMPFTTLVGQIFAANTKQTSPENRKASVR